MSRLVLWRFICSIDGVAAECIAAAPSVTLLQQHVLMLLLLPHVLLWRVFECSKRLWSTVGRKTSDRVVGGAELRELQYGEYW